MTGSLVLDSEGLSKLYRKDRFVTLLVEQAAEQDIRVMCTVMTLMEADDPRIQVGRVAWISSRIDVHEITRDLADAGIALQRRHNLHGHKYAIDATLAAVARAAPGPVTVVTSDPEDLQQLCGPAVRVVKI